MSMYGGVERQQAGGSGALLRGLASKAQRAAMMPVWAAQVLTGA